MCARQNRIACSLQDEHGFTTVGMALAIVLTLALLFSAAQVYRVQSASAEIQEVADAAALAAQNEVGEFMIVVKVCDAVVLSMTLLATTVYGIAVIALCIPGAQAISEKLIEMAGRITNARNDFAEKAAEALNRLQRTLPFIAAAQSAAVTVANNTTGAAPASYIGAALLIPAEGTEISVGSAGALEELRDLVEENDEPLRDATEAAEEAAIRANEAKERGFLRDCGDSPSYCMHERAGHLASLSGADNPLYSSVDTWTFGVALSRAKSYYRARLANEHPLNGSLAEQENSALRKIFFTYAVEQMGTAYVHETDTSFSANFPALPKNTDQMRATSLYTLRAFPVTVGEETKTMHAWPGCPAAAGYTALGSVQQLDGGGYSLCGTCLFKPSSLGNVASASTNIANGFEYHYAAVAQAAADYQKARADMDPKVAEVKETAGSIFDKAVEALQGAISARITASPPGAKGAVALVVNTAVTPAAGPFGSSFVAGDRSLGMRVAVSGAALIEEEADENSSVITALLDGLNPGGGGALGVGAIVLDCWSALLHFYGQGQRALLGAVESALSALPLASVSGLGAWAADALRSALEVLGLQPANINALKPVVINSGHVARAGGDGAAHTYASVKQQAAQAATVVSGGFATVADIAQAQIMTEIDTIDGTIEIARIELPVASLSIPVTITLPDSWKDGTKNMVQSCFDAFRSVAAAGGRGQAWR